MYTNINDDFEQHRAHQLLFGSKACTRCYTRRCINSKLCTLFIHSRYNPIKLFGFFFCQRCIINNHVIYYANNMHLTKIKPSKMYLNLEWKMFKRIFYRAENYSLLHLLDEKFQFFGKKDIFVGRVVICLVQLSVNWSTNLILNLIKTWIGSLTFHELSMLKFNWINCRATMMSNLRILIDFKRYQFNTIIESSLVINFWLMMLAQHDCTMIFVP